MATYKQSGVDVSLGDKCSRIAYNAAKETFKGRKGMIGEPLLDEGGFSGALDMGDYYLVQNDDGVGTKIIVAEKLKKFDTLGYDLVAMVADDAACIGAETITVSNTIDAEKIDEETITAMMKGLQEAALAHKIAVPGGEIAELGNKVKGYLWNATAVGIVEKSKLITCADIKVGDKIIGLKSNNFRSNGFSLVRYILENKFGENWAFEKYSEETSWGLAVLDPCQIYSGAIMELHGRYGEKPQATLKGIAHITGGGLPGNIPRIFKKTGLNANLNNLPDPPEVMKKLIELGNIEIEEAYRTWNMGIGMVIVSNDADKVIEACKKHDIEAMVIGEVVAGKLTIKTFKEVLTF
ncbi:phosphoribosylformylglycinamidine cyclo-ligase [Candidatus Peregrinibacteria bacterium]|nr:phosphoribosylformylglycinamidine cyclo-ligase [Candidatus Peregrinibacteria bacterium]